MSWFHRGLLLSETEQYTEAIESYDLGIKYGWFLKLIRRLIIFAKINNLNC